MTGSHEVRGSIPLGSTNPIKHLGIHCVPFLILCAYSVPPFKNPFNVSLEEPAQNFSGRL